MRGCFAIVLFCVFRLVYSQLGVPCMTPNKENAYCIQFSKCQSLRNITNLTSEKVQFLRSSHCGFFNNEPLVCCGYAENYKRVNYAAVILNTLPLYTKIHELLPTREQCGHQNAANRIFGGSETELDEFPWMALLGYRNTYGDFEGFNCGGVLISSRYVLTAAHCVLFWELFSVRLGEHDLRTQIDCVNTEDYEDCGDPALDILIEDIIVHEDYSSNSTAIFNDIALIRLAKEVTFTDFIRPICLPLNEERSRAGDVLFAAGWGVIDNGTFSNVKQKVDLNKVDQETCFEIFSSIGVHVSYETQLCTLGSKGKDSCKGDSGGPLMRTFINDTNTWYVEGLVSFGPKWCGYENIPGVYTNVINYIKWIVVNMKM